MGGGAILPRSHVHDTLMTATIKKTKEDADPSMFENTISILQNYLKKCQTTEKKSPLYPTIAMMQLY
jgi:hypothetical protein